MKRKKKKKREQRKKGERISSTTQKFFMVEVKSRLSKQKGVIRKNEEIYFFYGILFPCEYVNAIFEGKYLGKRWTSEKHVDYNSQCK